MLYWLLYEDKSFYILFGYVTIRTIFATVTSLFLMTFLGPKFIQYLRKIKFKESIKEDGPDSHHVKEGTPTMGGLLIIASMTISILLWGNLSNYYVLAVLVGTLLLTAIGFWDDYIKTIKMIPNGMKPRVKIILQILVGVSFSFFIYYFPYNTNAHPNMSTELYLPFIKDPILILGAFSIPFWTFIVTGTSNAVNLTDGLDGLAIGLSAIVAATLGVIAYLTGILKISTYFLIPFVPEANELTVVMASLVGASIGFLWYNSHPAEIFMGDTGSLAIGGAIGMTAICIKREILLIILGGVFVIEIFSVILQVGSFKLRGKRIFKMAPLHHHYELKGWHENKVVIRFWIFGILLALISLSSLKIV